MKKTVKSFSFEIILTFLFLNSVKFYTNIHMILLYSYTFVSIYYAGISVTSVQNLRGYRTHYKIKKLHMEHVSQSTYSVKITVT